MSSITFPLLEDLLFEYVKRNECLISLIGWLYLEKCPLRREKEGGAGVAYMKK